MRIYMYIIVNITSYCKNSIHFDTTAVIYLINSYTKLDVICLKKNNTNQMNDK